MKYVDSIIHARWIIPVEPSGTVIEDGMIAIAKGRVVAIGMTKGYYCSINAICLRG